MSAKSSGGGKTNRRAKDQALAAYMQKHPNAFPDSVMKESRRGSNGTPALAFTVQPARGGPIPHRNPHERRN